MKNKIKYFLDKDEKVKQLPAKKGRREEVFRYLCSKFEDGVYYTEKEVNQILAKWNTIGDYFILRRGLVDSKMLLRTPDGSQYWKNKDREDT